MIEKIIECVHYSFAYNGKNILNDLNFSVYSGDFLTIIGPNGAGKTTLLKCIMRIHESNGGGHIKISDKIIHDYSQKKLATILSYVPQSTAVTAPFSVHEFVQMGRYPYSSPFVTATAEDREAVEKALLRTGTTHMKKRYLNTLSGGERQKVIIAAALAQGARVMLLDEPTTFLDPKHQVEIYNLLAELNHDEDITIISVTHDVTTALMIGERILALKEGSIIFDGQATELKQGPILQDLYDTPFHVDRLSEIGKDIILPKGFVEK